MKRQVIAPGIKIYRQRNPIKRTVISLNVAEMIVIMALFVAIITIAYVGGYRIGAFEAVANEVQTCQVN